MKSKRAVRTAKKPAEDRKWSSFPLDTYRSDANDLVTHSFKAVNTNANGGGVRCDRQPRPDLPYVCARHDVDSIVLDYSAGATASVVANQIGAVLGDGLTVYESIPEEERKQIFEEIAPILRKPRAINGDSINMRMPQIIVDDGSGGDLCLTPLPCGGLSLLLHQSAKSALQRHAERVFNSTHQSAPSGLTEVGLKIGGDKLQNAGRLPLVSAMQRAFLFSVPSGASPGLRQAYAIHHRGISLRPATADLRAYGDWLQEVHEKNEKSTQDLRQSEMTHLQRMVDSLLARADVARAKLLPFVETGALGEIASPSLPIAVRGLLDPLLRNSNWRFAFAETLAQLISQAKDQEQRSLVGLSGRAAQSLIPLIEATL